jgi:hypothetical protein
LVLCLARRRAASEARHEAPSVGTVFRDLGGDEPFGALDAITRTRIRHDIDMLWMKTRKTGLFMTPSIEETIGLSDRVLVMLGGPGRIIEEIKIDLPRPVHLRDHPEFADYANRTYGIFDRIGVYNFGARRASMRLCSCHTRRRTRVRSACTSKLT